MLPAGSRSAPSGALGGDEPGGTDTNTVGDAATDVAVLAPLQLKVLECLEGLVFHNAELCQKVLAILKSFEVFLVSSPSSSLLLIFSSLLILILLLAARPSSYKKPSTSTTR